MLPIALLTALFSCELQRPDLIVDRNNSAAFPSLQAALAAAQPGDRILLRTVADVGGGLRPDVINKSVTIKGEVAGSGPDLRIATQSSLSLQGLTPGLPLVFENLRVEVVPMGYGYQTAIRSGSNLASEIVFDNVAIRSPYGGLPMAPIAEISSERLRLRKCTFIVDDFGGGDGCCREHFSQGETALTFSGRELFIEDSYLRGGSGGLIRYPGLGCEPGLCTRAGRGGSALISTAQSAVIVRTVLSDGNGGSAVPSQYWITPAPGPAGLSELVGPGGQAACYASTHETGVPGRGGVGMPRGPVVALGTSVAPLSFSDARIGAPFTITISPNGGYTPLLVFFGMDSSNIATAFGALHVSPIALFTVLWVTGPGTLSFTAPPDSALIDRSFVSQVALAAWNQPTPVLGNPSMTWFRR